MSNNYWYHNPKFIGIDLTRVKVTHTDIELNLVGKDDVTQLLVLMLIY